MNSVPRNRSAIQLHLDTTNIPPHPHLSCVSLPSHDPTTHPFRFSFRLAQMPSFSNNMSQRCPHEVHRKAYDGLRRVDISAICGHVSRFLRQENLNDAQSQDTLSYKNCPLQLSSTSLSSVHGHLRTHINLRTHNDHRRLSATNSHLATIRSP